jgi:hypothetical protein
MPWLSALYMMDGSSDTPGGMWMGNKVRIMELWKQTGIIILPL